jgi:uncharacterized membrane protein
MAFVGYLHRSVRIPAVQWRRLLILSGLLVGFALRLYRLGGESLWYDETVSVYLARLPLADMLDHTAGDIHPPGYYALLHVWQALTQPSLVHGLEFLFAWPSLVFGLLALPLIYAIGRRLFGERTAVTALWLAAFNPFQIWYSQEVRMYTLGAALGLLCLWALLQFAGSRYAWEPSSGAGNLPLNWLIVYVLAATAGLYTQYYFLFVLVALNFLALALVCLYDERDRKRRWQWTGRWIAAQVAVFLLWLPWLPAFWRQAVDPPVPPWRTVWDSSSALLHSLGETLAALLVGQTPPAALFWPWAVVTTLMLVGLFILAAARTGRQTTRAARSRHWSNVAVILLYVFVPIAILYAATLAGVPIYHVRYLALYAPLFLLVPAWLVVGAWRQHRWLGAAIWAALMAASALALVAFWTSPLYRADDHRQAVGNLAQAWRPGDAILANAGWIYPVLTTYWPVELTSDAASAPPALNPPVRMLDYAQFAHDLSLAAPLLVRSGSVDGPPSLGWGNPNSDFFAISREDTTAALQSLAQHARRIWHYRMYDTVSDPDGVIRAWLDEHAQLLSEQPIPGRDFGLVQLFLPPNAIAQVTGDSPLATFGGSLELLAASPPATATAGSYLYADLVWRALPPLASLPADLSISLRLYDTGGQQVAQADGPPAHLPTRAWETDTLYLQAAALPVPAHLPQGLYSLRAIVYRQDDAQPLLLDGSQQPGWVLGEVTVP